MKNVGIIEIISGVFYIIVGMGLSGVIGGCLLAGAFAQLLSGIGLLLGNRQIKKLSKELGVK